MLLTKHYRVIIDCLPLAHASLPTKGSDAEST